MPVLHFISSFGGISYKTLHDITSPFVSCCFTLAFIYISRYDFLQVFRTSLTIIGKKKFVTNYPFSVDSPKSIYRLNSQNPLNLTVLYLEARMWSKYPASNIFILTAFSIKADHPYILLRILSKYWELLKKEPMK